MSSTDSPEKLALHTFADHYDLDLSECDSFEDELDLVRDFIEGHESLSLDTEIEFTLTAELSFGLTGEELTWGEWWDHTSQRIQMNVADDGFSPREVTGVKIEEVWDF